LNNPFQTLIYKKQKEKKRKKKKKNEKKTKTKQEEIKKCLFFQLIDNILSFDKL
jgi:hypothetical protein